MGAPSTEDETIELNEKYELEQQQIEKLKAEIQSFRQQNRQTFRHGILSDEYSNYLQREQSKIPEEEKESEKKEEAEKQINAPNFTQNATKSNNNFSFQHKCKLAEYRKLSGHGNKVYCADWCPLSNDQIVSVGRDGKLIFWNSDTGYKRLAYPLDTELMITLKYAPNAKHVACGGLDDLLSIFPANNEINGLLKEVTPTIYKAHTGYISCLEYIDDDRILTSSGDATIREWDISHTASPKNTFKIHREDVMSISVNPKNNNLVLSGSVDASVKIMDLRSNEYSKVAHSFYMGYDQDFSKKNYRSTDVNVVKWFPDGTSFVAGCDDGTVRLFDIRSARILNEYSYHSNYLNLLQNDIMIDGATENEQNTLQQPATTTTKENDSIVQTSTNTCTPIVGSETDDKILQNGGMGLDNNNAYDLEPFEDYEDPTDGVATLDFSASGAFMFVSYNNDKHIVLAWNVLTGDVIQELEHDGHVPALSVSPDGSKLVTACWDHHLKLWM